MMSAMVCYRPPGFSPLVVAPALTRPLFAADDRSAKRRRLSGDAVEIEDRLESLIIRVGERVSRLLSVSERG